ncbi:LTA synthase family protein [Acinetobacter pullicarnis]|uniref:LTA synthase family protein n=1 Tax=Acinetobacter pullicarnis TaxID=2576829 RepID=UPI001122E115|nr:alkaline phosphatase family protein [Acinetobacter pullicarnis]
MTLFKQQVMFFVVAFLSVFIFFLVQDDLSRLLSQSAAQQKLRLFKYGFSILLNYALISGLYLLLRKTWVTILLSQFLVFSLSFINIQKENFLSASLVPSDFFLVKETLTAAPLPLKIATFTAIAVFLGFFIWLYRKEKSEQKRLILVNAILSVSIISFFITANFKNNFSGYCGTAQQSQLCKYTGYLPNTRGDWVGDHLTIKSLGFSTFFFSKSVDNLNNKIFQTEVIPQTRIDTLLTPPPLDNPTVAPQQETLPNVIFVMSESHWDATKLDRSIPKNITPTINKNQVSQMLSPSFGGGTANVEFEALTSLNIYLNHNELMYVSKIKRPIYSLAEYFNELGYDSTAMHNNGQYFYNRSAVYQHLGFQRFISIENMVSAADRRKYINQAGWANDDLLYESINQQLKQTDQPQFIYAISVENHPMYNDDRFGKDGFKITKPGVSDPTKRQLNTYLMGMQRADEKLKQLIATVEQLDRPTLIVFFGDHLPNLQNVYDEYGFFASAQEKAEKKDPKFFSTPLAVWSNFPIDRQQLKGEYIPAHFLASKVLTAAHLPLSPYYQLIQQINNCYTAVHQTEQPRTPQCQSTTIQQQMFKAYQDLNMDVMNGKNWTYQHLKAVHAAS